AGAAGHHVEAGPGFAPEAVDDVDARIDGDAEHHGHHNDVGRVEVDAEQPHAADHEEDAAHQRNQSDQGLGDAAEGEEENGNDGQKCVDEGTPVGIPHDGHRFV